MARVQSPGGIEFDLHSLGWKAFQDLCATILTEVLGQTIERFCDARDGGRDGAFSGCWKKDKHEALAGQFTIQCKFTAQRNKHLGGLDLSDDYAKAKRLAKRGLADIYILMTNAKVTGKAAESVRETLLAIPGIKNALVYGHDWICSTIRDSSRLRMLVPRVYGLGDLSQILDERAYAQSEEILSFLGDDLAKFVITQAYRNSAKALVRHGFLILLGEPACGKSTIAAALALAALDEWGCRTIKARNPNDFMQYSNPAEAKQFFWIDDAFGATQFDHSIAVEWNRAFPHLQAAIRRGARILFTSRDYVYRAANKHLKVSSFPLLDESQVVIQVDQLSQPEREQILYNHLRLGRQPIIFRSQVKPHLKRVSAHLNFKPEIARRLSNPVFTKTLSLTAQSLDDFVAKPLPHLIEVIELLDSASRAALAVVFMRNGSLASPLTLSTREKAAAELIGGTPASIRESLNALNGSLTVQVREAGKSVWRFKHPTMRDAFAAIVATDADLLDVYLAGSSPVTLIEEISCGGIGIGGVKVIVPADRYGVVIDRCSQIELTADTTRTRFLWFLARRCNRVFLEQYLERYPSLIDQLRVMSFLDAVADMDVIVCLNAFGLLPEVKRLEVVASLSDLAVSTPDSGFLHEDRRKIFSDAELKGVLQRIRNELIDDLDSTIDNWREDYATNGDNEPAGFFEPLQDSLQTYFEEFSGDRGCEMKLERALSRIEDVIVELQFDCHELDNDDDYVADGRPTTSSDSRSIFDDVDEKA